MKRVMAVAGVVIGLVIGWTLAERCSHVLFQINHTEIRYLDQVFVTKGFYKDCFGTVDDKDGDRYGLRFLCPQDQDHLRYHRELFDRDELQVAVKP